MELSSGKVLVLFLALLSRRQARIPNSAGHRAKALTVHVSHRRTTSSQFRQENAEGLDSIFGSSQGALEQAATGGTFFPEAATASVSGVTSAKDAAF